ncbi:extracellular solute-binding protein [Paludicola sp. MB14-C6]|uniref:extracellular solute-binding protein n=1 Tax=Paludihabitans sp. MB14-C6 TaxID=3070656 RepID=UPI0027DAE50D|nr:extracellular solute-binding protein [Paludicola sp. MB14-C6]WMJ22343.1 extracellular solute-binding protein [Paludicola sp. MB14-C6]
MLKTIFSSIIEISIVSSIIITLLAILYTFINKRYAAKWHCVIWFVIMLRLLVPINITLPSAPIVVPEPPKQEVVVNRPVQQTQPVVTEQVKGETTTTPTTPQQNISQKEPIQTQPVTVVIDRILIAAYVWLLGIFAVSVFYCIKRIQFHQYLKWNSQKVNQKRLLSMITQVSNEIRLSKNVTPILCKGISSPMVISLVKPKLLLPMLNYSDENLKAILRHELIHIKKNHLWFKFGILLCEIVYWFNPFVYLMTRFAQRDIEYACDSAVLKYTSESYKEEYSRAILSVIENTLWGNKRTNLVLSTGFSDGKKTLKNRFQNIFDDNKKKKGFFIIVALILVITIVGSIVVFGKKDVKQVNDSLTIYKYVDDIDDDLVSVGPGYHIKNMISYYKQKYPNVKVNLVEFKGTKKEYFNKLNSDVMAGKGPDVIVLDQDFVNYSNAYKLMKSGVLTELDDFIKQDKNINLNDYYKPIMDEGIYKNRRYILPVQFTVPLMMSGKQALKDAGINADNCKKDFWGLSEEMYRYYSQSQDKDKLIRSTWKYNPFIDELEYMGIRGAFDYNKETVKFDTNDFKKAMKQYKPWYQFDQKTDPNEYMPFGRLINEKKVLFGASLDQNPMGIFYYIQTLENKDQPVIIPIRTIDGGMEAQISTAVGIRNNSKNKQNAYNYIKLMLSPEAMYDYFNQGFSTNKKFAQAIITSNREVTPGHYSKEYDITYSAIPKECYKEVSSILDQVNGAHFYTPLTNQLIDYMKSYLEDKKSYEECIKEAKQKFELYLSE